MQTLYLLFSGTSTDGAGRGKYVGLTRDKDQARRHYLDSRDSPYSTGGVQIVTATTCYFANASTCWDDL
jgi:hypothetical protein